MAVAFLRGISEAWQRSRVLAGLFVLNVLFATVALVPFGALLREAMGASTRAAILGRGFAFDVFAEILLHAPHLVSVLGVGFAAAMLVWVLLSFFLLAGVVGCLLGKPCEAGLRTFLAAALEYGPAMARVWVASLVPYGIALLGGALLAGAAGGLVAHFGTPRLALWAALGGTLPALAWGLVTGAALDLARVRIVRDHKGVARRALWVAIRDCLRKPFRYVLLQVLAVAAVLSMGVAYLGIASASRYAFVGGTLVLTVLRQGLVLARLSVRVGTLAAMLQLDEGEGEACDGKTAFEEVWVPAEDQVAARSLCSKGP